VIYKHPFPSPKFKFLHTAETDIEDGVIIFSLEHAEAAFLQPEQFYNVAWYAYAEAFVKAYPNEDYPEIDDDTWSIIEKVQGLTQEKIMNTLGYESVDILPILISSYFYDAKKLASLNPTLHRSLQDIFS
jgi:hypothetical protein